MQKCCLVFDARRILKIVRTIRPLIDFYYAFIYFCFFPLLLFTCILWALIWFIGSWNIDAEKRNSVPLCRFTIGARFVVLIRTDPPPWPTCGLIRVGTLHHECGGSLTHTNPASSSLLVLLLWHCILETRPHVLVSRLGTFTLFKVLYTWQQIRYISRYQIFQINESFYVYFSS